MQIYAKICITSILYFLVTKTSLAQTPNFSFAQIDSIIKLIDKSGRCNGIEEFRIKAKKNIKNTGFRADWFYSDSSMKQLLLVFSETEIGSNLNYQRYYFFKDSLIFYKEESKTYSDSVYKSNWSIECYFINHIIFIKQVNIKTAFSPKRALEESRKFLKREVWLNR